MYPYIGKLTWQKKLVVISSCKCQRVKLIQVLRLAALGQHGVNIMEFCKAFNAATQSLEVGLPIPVVITVYSDKSFTFITKTPPAAVLLMKALGLKSGSGRPNTEKVGKVTREQLEEIAKTKEADLTAADLDAAVRTIAGSARSMGIDVEGV